MGQVREVVVKLTKDRTPAPSNVFGNDPEEEKLHGDYTVPQKVHTVPNVLKARPKCCKLITNIESAGSRIAILAANKITNATDPGDCTYRVISQNGGPVQFERITTPRPAPKVTLMSNWHTQQQQPVLKEGVHSSWNQHASSYQSGHWYPSQ